MMVELTPELIKDLSKTRNGFYSWDYVAGLAVWILGVEAENERLAKENELMVEMIKSLIASKNKLEDAYEYAKNNILLIYETATRLKGANKS